MSRCAIISGGAFSPLNDIEKCDYVIACDKGYEYALKNKILVDLVIGDFDSYQGKLPDDVEVIRLPVKKDDTDTMHAYRQAIDLGFKEVYLYCGLGGRLDHLFANIQCAIFGALHGIDTYFFAERETIIVSNSRKIVLRKKENCSLSVFAADVALDVSIKKALYEVHKQRLTNSFPIGQSNEWLDEDVIINKGEGVLIIIESELNNQ